MEEGLPNTLDLLINIWKHPTSFEEQNTCSVLITPFVVYLEKIRNHLN